MITTARNAMIGPAFIRSPQDLVTPYEEVRAGFLRLALEKNRVATPYVEEAKALKLRASKASNLAQLLTMEGIKPALLAAGGLSDKALTHLSDDIADAVITKLVETFLAPAGEDFVDELVFRYLLTKGDALGGKMRNLGGQLAQQQFIRALIATLSVQSFGFHWLDRRTNLWVKGKRDDPGIELQTRGIWWVRGDTGRTILLNVGILGSKKNVDLCLLNISPSNEGKWSNASARLNEPDSYIALGELKGGIDPAGADEHWKTANTALGRVRTAFKEVGHNPHLFLLAAAIATAMANEIFTQLQEGELSYAANLTNEEQLFDLCNWLVQL